MKVFPPALTQANEVEATARATVDDSTCRHNVLTLTAAISGAARILLLLSKDQSALLLFKSSINGSREYWLAEAEEWRKQQESSDPCKGSIPIQLDWFEQSSNH
ncbi:MAG TPA: hypothetical protein VM715_03875 [Candidatus Acidoferrum sp.]|nr:hypothetical protein [Candidatus Acidoferrum sp.]